MSSQNGIAEQALQPDFYRRIKPRTFPAERAMWYVLVIISIIAFLEVLPTLLEPAGAGAALLATGYALIPVAAIGLFVLFIDRWEPEPKRMYLVAFMWGAGASVLIALIFNGLVSDALSGIYYGIRGTNVSDSDTFFASYVAPLTEETIKGAGVLLIYFVFRRHFNGPIDGIVYGALIGSGFAFSENILYFVRYYDSIGTIFQVRFLDGPLNHEAWTAVFGFFVGIAAEKVGMNGKKNSLKDIWKWLVPGFVFAVLGHWVNNDALNWTWMTYERYMFINNVPQIIVLASLVIFASRQERNYIRKGLEDYLQAGWLTAEDLKLIDSIKLRRSAQSWAEGVALAHGEEPGVGTNRMKRFLRLLLELGYARTVAVKTGTVNTEVNRKFETQVLAELTDTRQKLNSFSAQAAALGAGRNERI
ncbi:MAG: PrsW family intramembrane metalloprotease [Arcanobacterium sp.]|nr:PrsW family intramembrane metalloprotease [Arcanobacterium sp.]